MTELTSLLIKFRNQWIRGGIAFSQIMGAGSWFLEESKNLLPVPVIPVTLTAATRIEDLFVFNSLNFEVLDNGYYSIKIDFHYRLEFKVREEGAERVITICTVTDITNHYQ